MTPPTDRAPRGGTDTVAAAVAAAGSGAGSEVESAAVPRLTDDDLTGAPPSTAARWWRDALDRLAGSDPGLTQLRTAVLAVLGMAVAVAGDYVLVRTTHALQVPAGALPSAAVAAQHHGVTVIAMLLGAITAMLSGFVVQDATARGQLVTSVLLPVPMLGAMTVGIVLGRWHVVVLVWLVVALMAGVYVRRFGQRGFAAGMVVFNGSFLGYFLGAQIPVSGLGWVAAELYVGIVASLLVRFAVLRPDPVATLRRMRRSWVARARRLEDLTHALTLTAPGGRDRARAERLVARQLVRLNESTLMFDAQLAQPDASPAAATLHQRLFDMELALANTARFAVALTARDLPAEVREGVQRCLADLRDDQYGRAGAAAARLRRARPTDPTAAVLVDRFAQSVMTLVVARREWLAVVESPDLHDDTAYTPPVELASGWLPGSGPVAEEATSVPGRRRLDVATMPLYVRSALQIGVAATLAIIAGSLVDAPRLYWALLATFLAFLATTNTGEQVRKALFRAGGTAIGIVVGAVAVHLVGGDLTASFAIIAVAMFLGIYLIRINYMFMVVAVTVSMSLLYVQLAEFSWHLLLLRLAETAVGVAAVVFTVLVVVPLRPQRVLTAGFVLYLRAVGTVVERSLATVEGDAEVTRADVRAMDAAYHSLVATADPLRHATFGRHSSQLAELLAVAAAVRNYARNLAVGAEPWPPGPALDAWRPAAAQLRDSLAAIEDRLAHGTAAAYVRSSALFDVVARALPAGSGRAALVVRDVMLVDAAAARWATALRMPVTDHDTCAPVATVPEGATGVRTAPAAG